jgi:TetR/AcrR family transcriptional regulator
MSIKERKEREKTKRRNDIIDAAEALFFSKGYDGVTMDDIARRTELNKATIYLYFNNKESLFFTIVLKGMKTLEAIVKERTLEASEGRERIDRYWDAYFEFAEKYPDHFRAWIYFRSQRFALENMITLEPQTQPISMAALINIQNGEQVHGILEVHLALLRILADAIRQGMEEGDLRHDLDPNEASIMVLMMLESLAGFSPVTKFELDTEQIGTGSFLNNARASVYKMLG